MAVPKRKTPRSKTRSAGPSNWTLAAPARSLCPNCGAVKLPHTCAATAAGTAAARSSTSTELRRASAELAPRVARIAIDAMGGDRAPGEIVAGALRRGRAELGVEVLLVGRRGRDRAAAARRRAPDGVELVGRHRGHRDGRRARRRRAHAEGLVGRARAPRPCATARPTRWSAPATPAPRWPPRCCAMGRIKGVARPAIAVPIPVPGRARRSSSSTAAPPSTARPSGSSQFALHGPRRTPELRLGVDEPTRRPAVERRGAGQGRRAAQAGVRAARGAARGSSATSRAATSCTRPSDVIVTDGFTGNVALKTIEGALEAAAGLVFDDPRLDAGGAGGGRGRRRRCCSQGVTDYLDPDTDRWRGAARRRRRVRDLARLVDARGRSSTRSALARRVRRGAESSDRHEAGGSAREASHAG